MSTLPGTSDVDLELEVELPPHPRSATRARAEVVALEPHAHPETIAKARLLVTELVGAAISGTARRQIRLHLSVTAGRVRGEVGRVQSTTSRRPEGWGLLLVQRISDDWGVGPDGSVWFEVGSRRSRFHRGGPARER